jgi:anthranilate synthase/aminodeoxychorismate synthase-like glutamine amidotransferase
VLAPDLEIRVVRNDEASVEDLLARQPRYIVLSPGPCTPAETGICRDLVRSAAGRIPIFGVCLGHQVIAEVHGMRVRRHEHPMHGKTSEICHDGLGIFAGMPDPLSAARYHSLIVDRSSVGEEFEVSAWTQDGEVMALRWKGGWPNGPDASMTGVQFHPESFMSGQGPDLVSAFLGQRG